MKGKVTLITPPDFYENLNLSVMFVHLRDQEQDAVSKWLYSKDLGYDLNLYVFDNETDLPLFFYALNRCEYKYLNLNNLNGITQALSGFALAKNNVYYKVDDANLASVYSHINNNRVNRVEDFLEGVLIDQINKS